MGISIIILSFINKIEAQDAMSMLGLGLACLAISQFSLKNTNN